MVLARHLSIAPEKMFHPTVRLLQVQDIEADLRGEWGELKGLLFQRPLGQRGCRVRLGVLVKVTSAGRDIVPCHFY